MTFFGISRNRGHTRDFGLMSGLQGPWLDPVPSPNLRPAGWAGPRLAGPVHKTDLGQCTPTSKRRNWAGAEQCQPISVKTRVCQFRGQFQVRGMFANPGSGQVSQCGFVAEVCYRLFHASLTRVNGLFTGLSRALITVVSFSILDVS